MTLPPTDHRTLFTADARFAAVPALDGRAATLKGYPIVFGVPSSDRGGFRVRIQPGAVEFTTPTHALYHHEFTGGPLGDTESATLRLLPPDAYGVPVEIDVPATDLGRDVFELVRTRRVRGMSFAMVGTPWTETENADGSVTVRPIRGLSEVVTEGGQTIVNVLRFRRDEVTVTAVPAFRESSVRVKVVDPTAAAYAETRKAKDRFDRFNLNNCRLSGPKLPARTV
jgi:HK97 family phage prohead protease